MEAAPILRTHPSERDDLGLAYLDTHPSFVGSNDQTCIDGLPVMGSNTQIFSFMEGCNEYDMQHIDGFQEAYDNIEEHHEIPWSPGPAAVDDQELAFVPDFGAHQDLLRLLPSSLAAETVAFSPLTALLNFEMVGTEDQRSQSLDYAICPPSSLPSLRGKSSSFAHHDEESAIPDDTMCIDPSVLFRQPDRRSLQSETDNHNDWRYPDPDSAEYAIMLLRCHHEGNESSSASTQALSSPTTSETTRSLSAQISNLASPDISLRLHRQGVIQMLKHPFQDLLSQETLAPPSPTFHLYQTDPSHSLSNARTMGTVALCTEQCAMPVA
ncbi:hypothetical protein CNYM01_12927 [Colletotrichum nymphaeae SA-01]|uniref:Uncharacterized protein n=1 Tax=Colletotrichum nymphaeae SA-01 TaxID=1460502 RepID=A0A135TRN2_9PEZI|nr:hypothetical protein CNYM01_12927 [Colletotrichum nymphaeae SA-01]